MACCKLLILIYRLTTHSPRLPMFEHIHSNTLLSGTSVWGLSSTLFYLFSIFYVHIFVIYSSLFVNCDEPLQNFEDAIDRVNKFVPSCVALKRRTFLCSKLPLVLNGFTLFGHRRLVPW